MLLLKSNVKKEFGLHTQSRNKRDSNPGSSALEADALTTRPTRQSRRSEEIVKNLDLRFSIRLSLLFLLLQSLYVSGSPARRLTL